MSTANYAIASVVFLVLIFICASGVILMSAFTRAPTFDESIASYGFLWMILPHLIIVAATAYFFGGLSVIYQAMKRQSSLIFNVIAVSYVVAFVWSVGCIGWILLDLHGIEGCWSTLHPVPQCKNDPSKFLITFLFFIGAGVLTIPNAIFSFFIASQIGSIRSNSKQYLEKFGVEFVPKASKYENIYSTIESTQSKVKFSQNSNMKSGNTTSDQIRFANQEEVDVFMLNHK